MSRHNLHNTSWTHAVNVFEGRKLFHRASQNSNLSVTARSCKWRQLLDPLIQFRLSWGQLGLALVLTKLLVSGGPKTIFSPKTKWCIEGQITFPSSSYLAFSPSTHLTFAFRTFGTFLDSWWECFFRRGLAGSKLGSRQDEMARDWHSKRARSCNIMSLASTAATWVWMHKIHARLRCCGRPKSALLQTLPTTKYPKSSKMHLRLSYLTGLLWVCPKVPYTQW